MSRCDCPVCAGSRLVGFLERDRAPVHQNLLYADRASARAARTGLLDLVVCEDCGFVFNRAFELDLLDYGEDYDNTQSHSPVFEAHMDRLVATLVEERGVRDCTIVEVGCGRGEFLRKLVAYPGSGNRGWGFDPSYVGPDDDLDGRLRFRRAYYDETCTDVAADVVVSRHVIEHVPAPMELLRHVRGALATAPDARVFFETPCVDWILDNRVLWDFFYEHCSLFTAASLATAFERGGFAVTGVDHVFGGQYLWLEGRVADAALPPPPPRPPGDTAAAARRYRAAEADLLAGWSALIDRLRAAGGVALWGAGAKGATFAGLIDPDCRRIDCVVDLNPNKQGRQIPGTGHPIVAPADLAARGVRSAIVMNPNYRVENERLLAAAGLDVELVDWSM